MANDTLLVISGHGIPDYSCRGAKQTLDPIDAAGVLARTVNGTLIDLSPTQMRKYKSTISCSDTEPPAFDGIWPGLVAIVDCVAELGYRTAGGSPQREVVEGSERVQNLWSYYRPRLTMLVVKYTVERDEWGAMTSWTLELEEQ